MGSDEMKSEQTLTRIAFNINSIPGAYALVLGSGISRAAGIKTGYEIVLDLIRRLAKGLGKDVGDKPDEWYREKFNIEPNYSDLIEKLGGTPEERNCLLNSYFEPSEEDKAEGRKQPTEAHRAIAKLCSYTPSSRIRLIITTNFDRLMETALTEQGVPHQVISNVDGLRGALPLIHSKCVVFKINGDYKDIRFRNTIEELYPYPQEIVTYLNRAFDDFGLIICGWSANYDRALRDALMQRANRRFSTFWAIHSDCSEEADQLIAHLGAEKILIQNANQFFVEMEERVDAINRYQERDPLSGPIAVERTKRYLFASDMMKMRDLIQSETERIHSILRSDSFNPAPSSYSIPNSDYVERMEKCEKNTDVLSSILATMVFYEGGNWLRYIIESIERLLSAPYDSGLNYLLEIQRYPALLVTYAVGTTAIKAKNMSALSALFLSPQIRSEDVVRDGIPPFYHRSHFGVFAHADGYQGLNHLPTRNDLSPISSHIFQKIHTSLQQIFLDEREYSECFDLFEYLFGLVYVDLVYPELKNNKISAPEAMVWDRIRITVQCPKGKWPPYIDQWFHSGDTPEIKALLSKGFFSGRKERFLECQERYDGYVLNGRSHRWFKS